MSKVFRPYEPDQMFLMPATLREWLPQGHLAYFISDVVEQLDLSAVMERYAGEERGYPPYHPVMMVKVLLYAYCIGVPSSRKIARRLEEDVAFRVLAANNRPDFRTISDFRKEHLKALEGLFLDVLRLCRRAGLVKLGHVALDGTRVKANASRHKAMSYRRMKEEEARLKKEIEALLREAEAVDAEEDKQYGMDRRGDELPEELTFKEGRLRKIQEAREALEAEARQEAERSEREGKEASGVPSDTAQRNFTDPDSRIMPGPGGRHFVQAYNAQVVVDSAHQVIVAAGLSSKPSDKGQAKPMTKLVQANTGILPHEMSADAGYYSKVEVEGLTGWGVNVYMPPDKMRHGRPMLQAPRGRIPANLSAADRMRRKLRTKKGRACYGLRKQVAEPVFGQIKQARGYRQFLLRSVEKVSAEWQLICTGHNLLKLFGAYRQGLMGKQSKAALAG